MIDRDGVPVELCDALLGEMDSYISTPETPELSMPNGTAALWSIQDEIMFLKSQMLGDEFGNYHDFLPTAVSTPVNDLKPEEDNEQKIAKTALTNARKYRTLLPEQLAALEEYVEGRTGSQMQKFAGSLRVRRIVPPSRRDNRYRVEFDAV